MLSFIIFIVVFSSYLIQGCIWTCKSIPSGMEFGPMIRQMFNFQMIIEFCNNFNWLIHKWPNKVRLSICDFTFMRNDMVRLHKVEHTFLCSNVLHNIHLFIANIDNSIPLNNIPLMVHFWINHMTIVKMELTLNRWSCYWSFGQRSIQLELIFL